MKFLIQTSKGEIVDDFSFVLLQSLWYHKWLNGTEFPSLKCDFLLKEKGWIPVGSVAFVQKYMLQTYGYTIKPRNIPIELQQYKFTKRRVFNGNEQIAEKENLFFKSTTKIKGPCGHTPIELPIGCYQYSSLVDFTSEWRSFIWRDELVGLQNYAGDFTEFPNVNIIKKMMLAFKESAPCAYTLDIGMVKGKTCVIEVHDFFSCGLYGFEDLQLLPLMLGGWFKEWLRSKDAYQGIDTGDATNHPRL